MVNNFLMCGKLGDFLHAMFAVKHICYNSNIKANVYMYDIGWEFGIEHTYAELLPIMMSQDYINSFSILDSYELDPIQTPDNNSPIRIFDQQLLSNGYIDLGGYIRSPFLYNACWSELYSKTFNFPIGSEYKWITHNKTNPDLIDKVIIQRKANVMRNDSFPYYDIITHYGKENVVFISSTDRDYNEFEHNSGIEFYKVTTLDDWFTAINSAALVIANLSAPAVIAHAMDKERIIELPYMIDAVHCIGEENYSKNIHWYLTETQNNLI